MSYTMSSLFFYNISEYLSVNKFFFYIFFSKMLYISTVAFQKNSCSRLWNYSINDTVNHICRNTAVQDENYTINTTQLYWGGGVSGGLWTCHPSHVFTKRFLFLFFVLYTKSLIAGRGRPGRKQRAEWLLLLWLLISNLFTAEQHVGVLLTDRVDPWH